MDSGFAAVRLSPDNAAQAFPLAQIVFPRIELETWIGFVRRRAGAPDRSGIVALRDERGYFCALFDYEIRDSLLAGPVLEIGLAIALDLLDRLGVAAALTRE